LHRDPFGGTSLNRHRFTRDHGFVDVAFAIDNDSVYRDFFTGTHPKYITLLDLIDGHLFFYSVLDATSRFRRETQERPDRFPRSIPCLRFQ